MTKKNFSLRKMAAIAICLAGVVMFSSCGGGGSANGSSGGAKYPNTPTGAVQEYLDYAIAGKFEKAAKCLYFEKERTDAEFKDVTKLVEAMLGNVKSYEIISEEIIQYTERFDNGKVIVKIDYGQGKEPPKQTLNTVEVDGKWKMNGGR